MRRTRSPNRPALPRGATRLIHLTTEWAEASSSLEDAFWSRAIAPEIDQLLAANNEKALVGALEYVWTRSPRGHDLLADLIEARAESTTLMLGGQAHDVILLALPILAWSRDRIPSGRINNATLSAVSAQLAGHVLSKQARVVFADALFSPDQMPHTYCESYELAQTMFHALEDNQPYAVDFKKWSETGVFVADTRLLLAAVAVPAGGALFRWQEEDISRDKVLTAWREQGGAVLQTALTGCTIELLMPSGFHSGSRLADRESRAFSVKAGVHFLQSITGSEAKDLAAVIAPFYDKELEEYRVSLLKRDRGDVLHGVVWPVLGNEMEDINIADEIETLLSELSVGSINVIDHKFPLEHCSDCGAPLFSDPEGELVHAGFPEDDVPEAVRFH